MKISEKREILADLAHERWSHWMAYLFRNSVKTRSGVVVIPSSKVERWERQARTKYFDLPENEKESDRREADRIIKALTEELN